MIDTFISGEQIVTRMTVSKNLAQFSQNNSILNCDFFCKTEIAILKITIR